MFDIRSHDKTDPAPGDLEVLQRFLNLHEHIPGEPGESPPSRDMFRNYLVERGLLRPGEAFSDADRYRLRDGELSDVAPTLLEIMALPVPETMTGRSLLVPARRGASIP